MGGAIAEPKIALVLDVKQRRPACVLIQAAFGCRHSIVSTLFDSRSWLLAPTDDMRKVEGTLSEWRGFAAEVNSALPPRPGASDLPLPQSTTAQEA